MKPLILFIAIICCSQAYASSLAVSPAQLDFTSKTAGLLTVLNPNDESRQYLISIKQAGNWLDPGISSLVLGPGQSYLLEIKATPQLARSENATIYITDNSSGSISQSIAVKALTKVTVRSFNPAPLVLLDAGLVGLLAIVIKFL